mgnify:CR=1 FL=1|tara:strand:+ start:5946 stop:6788 length:843 start_codon:yes stop_codon:yes gene_type:complete
MKAAPKGRNLAGIVPIAGKKDQFDFPWPDYLQPLREGFLAVERSIKECAMAGCDSIWIVVNDDTAPIVRKRIGDYVMDPRYFEEKDFVKRKSLHEKWIPIYYTPVSQKDRDRRDSLGWSVLHGALSCYVVSSKLSRWTKPTKYFVSYPLGIYPVDFLKEHRSDIRGSSSFCLSYKGQTFKDGKFLSFTFFPEEWVKLKRNIKQNCSGGDKSIPFQERWSSRFFGLDKIFGSGIIKEEIKVEIQEYYDLDSWESLQSYYKSEMVINRPSLQFMKPYRYKKE